MNEKHERLRLHRELEFLRAVGAVAPRRGKRKRKKDAWEKQLQRVNERASKLDQLPLKKKPS